MLFSFMTHKIICRNCMYCDNSDCIHLNYEMIDAFQENSKEVDELDSISSQIIGNNSNTNSKNDFTGLLNYNGIPSPVELRRYILGDVPTAIVLMSKTLKKLRSEYADIYHNIRLLKAPITESERKLHEIATNIIENPDYYLSDDDRVIEWVLLFQRIVSAITTQYYVPIQSDDTIDYDDVRPT